MGKHTIRILVQGSFTRTVDRAATQKSEVSVSWRRRCFLSRRHWIEATVDPINRSWNLGQRIVTEGVECEEKEQENHCNSYQSVCDENHPLKRAMYDAENQIQQQLLHEQNAENMLHKAKDHVKILLDENERVVSDLKVRTPT